MISLDAVATVHIVTLCSGSDETEAYLSGQLLVVSSGLYETSLK